jgi:hypothetical protein
MNKEEKGKYIAALGAFLVHLVLIILLVLLGISVPVPTEESGVPVMLGEMADAQGEFDPSTLVDVDIMRRKQQRLLTSRSAMYRI